MPTTSEYSSLPYGIAQQLQKNLIVVRFPREQFLSRITKEKSLRSEEDIKAYLYHYIEVFPSDIKKLEVQVTDTDIIVMIGI